MYDSDSYPPIILLWKEMDSFEMLDGSCLNPWLIVDEDMLENVVIQDASELQTDPFQW